MTHWSSAVKLICLRYRLVELKMTASPVAVCPPVQPDVSLTVPVAIPESPQGAGGSARVEVKQEIPPTTPPPTLPRFEPYSPLPGSGSDARLKVHLARLNFEAEEKACKADTEARERARKQEQEFQLAMQKLELETEVKLRQLELQNAAERTSSETCGSTLFQVD